MATLMELPELKDYLRHTGTEWDGVLQQILDATEDMFEGETGRTFGAATTITNEPLDGLGVDRIWTNRPVTSLTTVQIGQDVADPTETVPLADLVFDDRRVMRIDGCVFPLGRRNVFVTYDTAEDVPALAKLAIQQAVALQFRIIGKEHVRSESLGDLGSEVLVGGGAVGLEFGTRIRALPAWRMAVSHLSVGTWVA